jgi:hypothetical protein
MNRIAMNGVARRTIALPSDRPTNRSLPGAFCATMACGIPIEQAASGAADHAS